MRTVTATTAEGPGGFGAALKKLAARLPLHIIVVVIAILWMTPAFGLLVSSFRPATDIASTGWWTAFQTPFKYTLENYSAVISQNGMGRSFLNSLIISVPGTVIPILVAGFAAFAFAWMKFRGRDIIFMFVVALLVVPVQMTLIPVLRLLADTHLVGTFPGIWIAHTAYGLPFAIFLLRNFFAELPKELLESAYLDGASNLRVFFRTVAINNLVSSFGTQWQLLTAAAFISMMLPLVIFIALQRYFVEGITAGAIKG
jgi:alpha-glucoside transport system permease protein